MMEDLFSRVKTPQEEMREGFMKSLRDGAQRDCPCCGRYAQVYKRRINHSMAVQLIELYKKADSGDFIHFSAFAVDMSGRDFTISRYWELIERPENTDLKKKTNGYWRLTEKGRLYVENRITIPEYAVVFADELLSFSKDRVSITDAIGRAFDYQELMGGVGEAVSS